MSEKYANKENLERFWDKAKEYIGNERKEIEDQLYNWQKTEKAPVVQCEPVPNSDLHPIVDFMFTETPPASGDKSPSNPSTITGVSNIGITRCGKNLLSPKSDTPVTSRGVTFEYDPSDGGIFIQGQAGSDKNPFIDFIDIRYGNSPAPFVKGKTYSFYLDCQDSNVSIQLYDKTTDTISGNPEASGTQFVHTINSNSRSILFRLSVEKGATVNTKAYIQVEEGSAAIAFEPYSGTDYPLSLNNTYYGGSIDLATGKMTVTHKADIITHDGRAGSVLTNTVKLWCYSSSRHIGGSNNIYWACDKFPCLIPSNTDVEHIRPTGSSATGTSDVGLYISKSRLDVSGAVNPSAPTDDEWRAAANAWLANNPVTFVYQLKESYTVQLTPQQIKSLASLEGTSKRINTLYTDADFIQVEYQKYVGVDSTLDNTSENAIQNKVVNSALNTKVSLTGDEVIAGSKTFSSPINGSVTGDAGTVAGHIVSKDVPVNAAFTDTTYEPATQSTAGLMSAADKTKLDAVGSVFTFKGSVIDDTYLPASDNASGDAYLAEDTGHVHVYDGSSFVDIGIWAGIPSATDAQIDALFED